ncbi:MAG: hypothetical protein P0121_13725 [Nitrospira sp.]|nr:hypothetical protein [Nitrospira sp.]
MLSGVGWDRSCFVSLALLALLFMQGYSSEVVGAETSDVDQPASSPEGSETNATEEAGQQSTSRGLSTAGRIAGRGYQLFRYKGIVISPGGFFDGTAIFRSTNENADVQSTYGNIALQGSANSHLSEFRGTARGSRLNLLVEGEYRKTAVAGYVEFDFLGGSTYSNELETNSWGPRLRQVWGNVDLPNGLSVLFGQSWSLLTTYRDRIKPRHEFIPLNTDLQTVVGNNWARQWGLRVTKAFGPSFLVAVSIENPETNVNGVVQPTGVQGFNTSSNAQNPSNFFTTSATPGANGISTDLAPDIVGKLVWEPRYGHWEMKGLLRFFRDRLGGENHVAVGGGLGLAAVLPVTPRLTLIAEGLVGQGIGRYASTIGADVVASPSGRVVPIPAVHFMAGLEWHPGDDWDVYAYYGLEHYARTAYAGTSIGYGSPLADLSGCGVEDPGTQPCHAGNQTVSQVQPGFWYRMINSDLGIVALGLSYQYTHRTVWSGLGGIQPWGEQHTIMTTIRYYLP